MSTMQAAQRTYGRNTALSPELRQLDAFSGPPPEFPLLCVTKRRSEAPSSAETGVQVESRAHDAAEECEWLVLLARAKATLATEEADWQTLRALATRGANEDSEWREQLSRATARDRPQQPPPLPVRRKVA